MVENVVVIVSILGCFAQFSFWKSEADYLIITHEHFDHFDTTAIQLLTGDNTQLVTNLRCTEMLGYGTMMANGDMLQLADGITLEAVPAYNIAEGRQQFHPMLTL